VWSSRTKANQVIHLQTTINLSLNRPDPGKLGSGPFCAAMGLKVRASPSTTGIPSTTMANPSTRAADLRAANRTSTISSTKTVGIGSRGPHRLGTNQPEGQFTGPGSFPSPPTISPLLGPRCGALWFSVSWWHRLVPQRCRSCCCRLRGC